MTDKQIIDGIDVPSKSNNYRLGRTKIERQQVFEDIKEMIENGFSLQNIADKYGVTRQAISLKMINCGFCVSQEVKRIKREKIKELLEETTVNNVEKLNRKVTYYKTYNFKLRNDLTELKEKLSRKEQECEELKNKTKFMEEYIKTVENARDELERENKFLKEENKEIRKYQYEQDFLQEQLEAYKMEAEEGKEINAELKAENEGLKKNIEICWENLKIPEEYKREVSQPEPTLEKEQKNGRNKTNKKNIRTKSII